MYPGSNIYNQAIALIGKSTFDYYAWQSRTLNTIGTYVNTYAAPVSTQGSVQPVPRAMYAQLGLQFNKNYLTIFVPINLTDISRDTSSDKIVFNGTTYQLASNVSPWYPVDGWAAGIFVETPDA